MTHALQAADAVLALINAQPRTPTREEIAALIQRTMQPMPPERRLLRALVRPDFPMAQDPAAPPPRSPAFHRAEWNQLIAKLAAAEAALPYGLDEDHELVVAVDAISTELDECARRIIKLAATRPAEIRLLAEVCYWAQWGDGALDAPTDALLARETADLGDEALAALLRGIRDVTRAHG